MLKKLKNLFLATLCSAAFLAAPSIGGTVFLSHNLFGTSPAMAGNGNGNGNGVGNGGGHGNSGDHGGGKGGGHGKSFDTGPAMKTAHGKSGQPGSSHGKGFGVAQSFADTVGKGVGKASSSVQSMFDGVFGRGHSKGTSTASIETTPEDVPVPTGRPDKSRNIHAELRSLSSLGRAPEAYAHSQSSLMTAMRSYISHYGEYQDNVDTMTPDEQATALADLQDELAGIVSTYGGPGATTTTPEIDPATGNPTGDTVTTVNPEVAGWIDSTLGDPTDETSKFSEIRGMLDNQAATDATTTSSTATDPAAEDPAPAD